MNAEDGWDVFSDGSTIGQAGSEEGVILLDEEHANGIRITLERDGHTPFAITCGVYGTMVHTCFFGSDSEARTAYAAMKPRLVAITNGLPSDSDSNPDFSAATAAIQQFIDDFP